MFFVSQLQWVAFAAFSFTALPLSSPSEIEPEANARSYVAHPRLTKRATQNLRILPLGDSITFGAKSSDGNGYRLDLREKLTSIGGAKGAVGLD